MSLALDLGHNHRMDEEDSCYPLPLSPPAAARHQGQERHRKFRRHQQMRGRCFLNIHLPARLVEDLDRFQAQAGTRNRGETLEQILTPIFERRAVLESILPPPPADWHPGQPCARMSMRHRQQITCHVSASFLMRLKSFRTHQSLSAMAEAMLAYALHPEPAAERNST